MSPSNHVWRNLSRSPQMHFMDFLLNMHKTFSNGEDLIAGITFIAHELNVLYSRGTQCFCFQYVPDSLKLFQSCLYKFSDVYNNVHR